MSDKVPLTALVITKNEGFAIRSCLGALEFCDQVIVVDSSSSDETCDIAIASGAIVINFEWNGAYPKKKQWAMEHPVVRNNWVLHLDADEIVPRLLQEEIAQVLNRDSGARAYEIPLAYTFSGRRLRYGHKVFKRALVDRRYSAFPEVGDLNAPGISEVEGHYQPIVDGPIEGLRNSLDHNDPDPVASWIARHNRYSDWEAHLRAHDTTRRAVRGARSRQGRIFDRMPGKPVAFFVYAYIVRLGFLDGRPGFDYAFALTWYYWLTSVKVRESRHNARS